VPRPTRPIAVRVRFRRALAAPPGRPRPHHTVTAMCQEPSRWATFHGRPDLLAGRCPRRSLQIALAAPAPARGKRGPGRPRRCHTSGPVRTATRVRCLGPQQGSTRRFATACWVSRTVRQLAHAVEKVDASRKARWGLLQAGGVGVDLPEPTMLKGSAVVIRGGVPALQALDETVRSASPSASVPCRSHRAGAGRGSQLLVRPEALTCFSTDSASSSRPTRGARSRGGTVPTSSEARSSAQRLAPNQFVQHLEGALRPGLMSNDVRQADGRLSHRWAALLRGRDALNRRNTVSA